MFFDLNVPVPSVGQSSQIASKKGKAKQQAQSTASVTYNATQIKTVEARVDLLVRCESHFLRSLGKLNTTLRIMK